jgi:hypothetical protein
MGFIIKLPQAHAGTLHSSPIYLTHYSLLNRDGGMPTTVEQVANNVRIAFSLVGLRANLEIGPLQLVSA